MWSHVVSIDSSSCLGVERLSETCPCLRSKQLINKSSLNHLDYLDTIQKINMEPENDGIQVRNLLLQWVIFRWTMLSFGECSIIWVCTLKSSPRCNQWHPRSKSCRISLAHAIWKWNWKTVSDQKSYLQGSIVNVHVKSTCVDQTDNNHGDLQTSAHTHRHKHTATHSSIVLHMGS